MSSFEFSALLRVVPVIVLSVLAFYFGQTLRRGYTPLIERIARVSDPALPPVLCRYTRRLTALWCFYFIGAALFSALLGWRAVLPAGLGQIIVGAGALALFVGEHALRPVLFPGHSFPGLLQQIRDTRRVWGVRNTSSPSSLR